MNRTKVLIWGAISWLSLEFLSWLLGDWFTKNITSESATRVAAVLKPVVEYLTSGFSLGFMVGAILFSMWDWPVLRSWIKRYRLHLSNKEKDQDLANQCEALSKNLFESASQLERLRMESHWQSAQPGVDPHDKWIEARQAEAREEERIRRLHGHQVQSLLIELKARHIQMDLWGFSLRSHDIASASYFFLDIAKALRSGEYLDRTFKPDRFSTPGMI